MSRRYKKCFILGEPKTLSVSVLPTVADVLKYYSYVLSERKQEGCSNNNLKVIKIICKKVVAIWERASIPCVSEKRITTIITKWLNEREKLIKSFKRDHNTPSYKDKLGAFLEKTDVLLDIASCKCKPIICSCEKEFKVKIYLN